MASFATSTSTLTTRPVCRAPRSSAIVCSARKQEQKPQTNKVAQLAAAGLAAIFISVSPAFADQALKQKICATNPTSKICLLGSAKK